MDLAGPGPLTRVKKPQHLYQTPDGKKIKATAIDKFLRDVVAYQTGHTQDAKGKLVTVYDPADPLQGTTLRPGPSSPICAKCGLDQHDAKTPYIDYRGPDQPLITVIFDAVNRSEDDRGFLAADQASAWLRNKVMLPIAQRLGFDLEKIRWVPLTRCANRLPKLVNYKVKGNWCRLHLIQDLMAHPPRLIVPVGTVSLGALSHKSNAQEWAGRLLTWRGWPDDWLTEPKFCLPRENPVIEDGGKVIGHPLFGAPPVKTRIPMFPVQAPRLVLATQNPEVKKRFVRQVEKAMKLALSGVPAPDYHRPWYRITQEVDEIEAALNELVRHPGIVVGYDTETTGLIPWIAREAIVFMMFRWVDPASGEPRSIGFPWDFESIWPDHPNRVRPYIPRLRPLISKVLSQSSLVGHNLTFDILFTFAKLLPPSLDKFRKGSTDYNKRRDRFLCALADASLADTWHMAYTHRQQPGSRGLEAIVYDYAPDLAGYEEDMTLLIDLHYGIMHPEARKGGHYANCPPDKWKSHLEPYVLGDVEATYTCWQELRQRLDDTKVHPFPLADPRTPGRFRDFTPPNRAWVYDHIMAPAAKLLMKVMGRGMFVSLKTLKHLEHDYPKQLDEARKKIANSNSRVIEWCRVQKAAEGPDWELDLESKSQLREVLFNQMGLDIQRLTLTGRRFYGEEPAEWDRHIAARFATLQGWDHLPAEERAQRIKDEKLSFAALDKFTLNKLAVDHEEVRPLQDYRRVFKMYTAYVNPMRAEHLRLDLPLDFDEMLIDRDPHLGGLIHPQLLQTSTRSGRLAAKQPNTQQLPRKGDVKKMFTSRFGARGCLLSADCSQIELRLLAAASGDPTMLKAYADGQDLHTLTASRLFGMPYETFSKEHIEWLQQKGRDKEAKDIVEKRTCGKQSNFITGYGGGAFGLQTTLAGQYSIYKTLEFCESIIDRFFDSYPMVRRHIQVYKRFICETGRAVSIFGRVRLFEEVYGDDDEARAKAMRAGYNHLIQSTAADMLLVAMIAIEEMMRERDLESILCSTVHDSLLADCVRAELPVVHEIIDLVMNNFKSLLLSMFGDDYDTSWMTLEFAGDQECGTSYGALRTVPKANIDWDKLLDSD